MMHARKLMSDFQGEITQLLIIDPATAFPGSTTDRIVQRIKSLALGVSQSVTPIKKGLLLDIFSEKLDESGNDLIEQQAEVKSRINDWVQEIPGLAVKWSEFPFAKALDSSENEGNVEEIPPIIFGPIGSNQLSKYIRDFFLTQNHRLQTTTLLTHMFTKKGKAYATHSVPGCLSMSYDILLAETDCRFEGGDVLCGGGVAIIGHRTMDANEVLFNSVDLALKRLEDAFGVPVICPVSLKNLPNGMNAPPSNLYHVDLFLTLFGVCKGAILVAVATVMIWDGNSWRDADPELDEQKYLDHFVGALEAQNGYTFKVQRMPLLMIEQDHKTGVKTFYSYNNCLVETSPSGKAKFILPSFKNGLPTGPAALQFGAADDKVAEIVKCWGCEPVFVQSYFHDEAWSRAGLRCLTQVLRRTTD
jgi:hypothetical protein